MIISYGECDRPAFFFRSGMMIDLNAALGRAGGNIASATAMNDRRRSSYGVVLRGAQLRPHAVLLTPLAR
jgi:hypothetical protein